MSKCLKISLNKKILTITLDRPESKNAFNLDVFQTLTKEINNAANDDGIDFVVLTGEGDFYSSGMDLIGAADVQTSDEGESSDIFLIGRQLVAAFIDFPKLLIAIVNGPAIGIAFTTLNLCDVIYCSTKAYFWAPFTLRGLNVEGCASYLLPKMVGNVKANEIIQLNKKISPSEAKQWNLVTKVFEPNELNTIIWPEIHKLHDEVSIESVMLNKKIMRDLERPKLHKLNVTEWQALQITTNSDHFINSIMKFASKKMPKSKI